MTEFKRTKQAVDESERLVQVLLDGGGTEDALRLSKLVGETGPIVDKLSRKAAETDPAKQTYGPKMREQVRELGERWISTDGLARDVLRQRGVSVQEVEAGLAPPPTAPAPAPVVFLPQRQTPIGGGVPASATQSAPRMPSSSSSTSTVPASSGRLGGTAAVPSGAGSADQRRQQAARAAEARSRVGGAASSQPPPSAGDTGVAPMVVDGGRGEAADAEAAAAAAGPATRHMADLLALVHQVFVGHGFAPHVEGGAAASTAAGGTAPFRVRYARAEQLVSVSFVPVQRHLVVYAALEGDAGEGAATRAAVQLGMASASVMAKVDYLLVYPLLCSHCVPTLQAVPPEVCFGLLLGLALPGLAALGAASRSMARSVFEDDVLWWRIALSLPRGPELSKAIEEASHRQRVGEAAPAGEYRLLVKTEVQRRREEAEKRRRLEEERRRLQADMARRMQEDPLRLPGGRPFHGGPGRPGFGGTIGGDYDLFPGGGAPFGGGGGGRRPWGGGPFGGGGFGGFG